MQAVRKSSAIAVASLIVTAAWFVPLHAEPLITPDRAQLIASPVSPRESRGDLTDLTKTGIALDDTLTETTPASATNPPHGISPVSRTQPSAAEPGTSGSLHNVVKETVRPVYDELTESGALDTWRDLKENLGLGQNSWPRPAPDDDARVRQHPPESANAAMWQDPSQRPKSAAQTRIDREYDAYLLRELIDDLKPWVLGLIGLYALGYLTKLIFSFMRWKAVRRRERRALRARHRASRRSRRTKQENGTTQD